MRRSLETIKVEPKCDLSADNQQQHKQDEWTCVTHFVCSAHPASTQHRKGERGTSSSLHSLLQDFDVREGSHEYGPYYHYFDVHMEPLQVGAADQVFEWHVFWKKPSGLSVSEVLIMPHCGSQSH